MVAQPGEKLVARGHQIVLADGSVRALRYSMRSLVEIETEWGSLQGMQDALSNSDGRIMTSVSKILQFGIEPRMDFDEVLDGLELARFQEYFDVLALALAEAFPDINLPTRPRATRRAAARGKSGTTSARSRSVAAKRSSGR
jgi:hypothetical protein